MVGDVLPPKVSSLFLAALALVACGGGREEPSGASARHPDVVLVVADTLRADHLGTYGHDRPTSPGIDALAEGGVVFERCSAECSWTKPSMVALMTSRRVTEFRDRLDPDAPALAEVFREAGYRTLAAVSNTILTRKGGFARGFDVFDWQVQKGGPGGPGRVARTMEELVESIHPSLTAALRTDERGERPPVFLYIHAMEPHFPYAEHPDLAGELPLEGAWTPSRSLRAEYLAQGIEPPPGKATWEAGFDRLTSDRVWYEREIRTLDERLSRLLEELEALGLGEGAIHALTADHGEVLFERPGPHTQTGLVHPHHFLYREHGYFLTESLTSTPLILWGGAVPRGLRVSASVESVDLMPTLLELAGIARPEGIHGQSLVALMEDPELAGKPFTFSSAVHVHAVREAATNLKLLVPTPYGEAAGMVEELHDLSQDPTERRNLLAGRSEDARRLRMALEAHLEAHPTPTTLGQAPSEEEQAAMQAMGYAGGDGRAVERD